MGQHFQRLVIAVLLGPAPLAAQTISPAIENGKRALLDSIDLHDELILLDPAKREEKRRVRGKVIKQNRDVIHLRDDKGKAIALNRRDILHWIPAGMVRPELEEDYFLGGPSALAALALTNAGVELGDKKFAVLLDALANQDVTKTGTYVRSLRACLWSALVERPIPKTTRAKYKKLLGDDVRWLVRAGGREGLYTYTMGGGGDHSNTQFANLGLWAGGIGGIEIATQCWQTMSRHWLETQSVEGGWNYARGLDRPTSSMTVAGCNSLYITLDRFYSRNDYAYVIFEGARPNKMTRQAISRIHDAIRRGDDFLKKHPPDIAAFHGYELFGLERLGLASGSALIGGQDWFDAYAEGTAARRWGGNPIADAFALIFLVHGRAPILFQKLEHGSFEDWNYYHRDLASLSRYLSRTFERIYRWQRIDPGANLMDLQRAPILYISGHDALEISKSMEKSIREYINDGGTIFLHSDRASKIFSRSAEKLFEKIFAKEDIHFADLREDHPVYRCHFGSGATAFKRRIPLRGMSDGSRICVFLCPVDIAGAWHQDREKLQDLFRIMANVRVYSVPSYGELLDAGNGPPAPRIAAAKGSISLARLKYSGRWNLHPRSWTRYASAVTTRTGLDLQTSTIDADHLDGVDIVYCCVSRHDSLKPQVIEKISKYLQNGGLLLIDAADGQPQAISAVGKLFEQLAIGQSGVLDSASPIFSGAGLDLGPLPDLKPTIAGSGLSRAGGPPPILTRSVDGPNGSKRIVVLACPFDLIAALDGPFIYNRSGYTSDSTRELVDRILLWRWDELQGNPAAGK